MAYLKQIKLAVEGKDDFLYVTDDAEQAEELRRQGAAVLIYLHTGNRDQNFSGFLFAVEDPEDLEPEYIERVYRRLKGLPWNILETSRCLVRETMPEDVEEFYRIYREPAVTRYTEELYSDIEEEKQYAREYMEAVYAFYGFGIWTIVEKSSGAIIGKVGFEYREGFEDPEIGFVIGVPWQRKGYAIEVCRAVLDYGWRALDFQRVRALVEPANTASLGLCEKLGLRIEGKTRINQRTHYQLFIGRPR